MKAELNCEDTQKIVGGSVEEILKNATILVDRLAPIFSEEKKSKGRGHHHSAPQEAQPAAPATPTPQNIQQTTTGDKNVIQNNIYNNNTQGPINIS